MNKPIYVYKMVADNGGAPCVFRGLLSLALCKPKIRKGAGEGALVFGFGGKKKNYGERLIYVAEVTSKPKTGDYYLKRQFATRPDCIYRKVDGKVQRKASAQYHNQSDERQRDVGMRLEKAYVLLSDRFRYFGKQGTAEYKKSFKAIKAVIESLTRGHRVNHSPKLYRELRTLKAQLWRKHRRMKVGDPIDSDSKGLCNSNSPSACIRPDNRR
jgi:hypothetical protein